MSYGKVIHLCDAKRLRQEEAVEDAEACIDLAGEAAVDAGMTLNDFVARAVRWYRHYEAASDPSRGTR